MTPREWEIIALALTHLEIEAETKHDVEPDFLREIEAIKAKIAPFGFACSVCGAPISTDCDILCLKNECEGVCQTCCDWAVNVLVAHGE